MPSTEVPSPFQLLDFVPSGCCVIGEGGAIVFWNQTLENWTRQPAAEMAGRNLFDVFPELNQSRFRERILDTLRSGAPMVFSPALNPQFFPCTRAGGRPRVQQTAVNRFAVTGFGPLALITVTDVTDQFERGEKYRAARAQVIEEARVRHESEEQHRLIVGLTSAAIFICHGEQVLDSNASASRIFLHPPDELRQIPFADLFPYKHAETIRRLLREDLATGDSAVEMEGRRKNGTLFPAEITAKFFTAAQERRSIVYIHDISDRKRAEEALAYARKQESLGSLAGGIAHDFNNLFCGVLGHLDLAQKLTPAELPALGAHLDRIRGEMVRAAELSQQMLAFSGKGKFSIGPVDLNRLLEEQRPQLTMDLAKEAEFRYELAGGLPRIEGDPMQIQQVVRYLVANASEALEGKVGRITLATSLRDLDASSIGKAFPGQPLMPGPHVVLTVTDTGCGIAPENLPRIFDPFFSTKFAGRGLSLAVAIGILRGHKAGFTIDSAPGRGTCFRLFFPIVPFSLPSLVNTSTVRQQSKGAVLFVDDEPALREAAEEILTEAGYPVLTAQDGVEALACYRSHAAGIALVVLDLTMPRMDGRETLQALLALDPGLKVILSSGYSEHDVTQQFHETGPVGFLPKPYRAAQLTELVSRFVSAD